MRLSIFQTDRYRHLVSRMARRIVCLMGVAALVCVGAEGPVDEMEAVWIAQDGPIPTNMTHAAWRVEKLARRTERLKPVVAMSKTWAYCRHYVLGRRSTFLHLSELSDAFEQRSYRAIGSSLCLAEYQPDGLWKETTLLSSNPTFHVRPKFQLFHADNFKCSAVGAGFSRLSPRKAV